MVLKVEEFCFLIVLRSVLCCGFWNFLSKGNCVGRCGLDSSGSGQGPVVGCCEHDN
jgi:hypothetical protein